jgi:cephalosporin-C deacetylase
MTFSTRYFMLAAILNFFTNLFNFTTVEAQPIALNTTVWRFQIGDDPTWATPQYNDQNWQSLAVGKAWETVIGGYDTIGWYRKTLIFNDKAFQKAVKRNGGLVLRLGKIDDADETYFNGVKIGAMGQFPPIKESAWDKDRVYIVPPSLINWKKPNVIAVRVADWGGGGGMYAGDYVLEPLSWRQRLKMNLKATVPSHYFEPNTQPTFSFSAENNWKTDISGTLNLKIKKFTGEVVVEQSKTLDILRGVKLPIQTFVFDNLTAGFYIAHAKFSDANGRDIVEKQGFAVAPTVQKAQAIRPADFDQFWTDTKAELASVAPNFRLEPTPQYSNEKVEVFTVEMRSLGNVRVKGFYTRPRGKTNLPALLVVHGYSSDNPPYDLEETRYAQFFINLRGHGISRDDVNPGFPSYFIKGLDNEKNYIYRGAYMDAVRSVDFLASQPEIDTKRIGVTGVSQGGALSFAVTALDERIQFCVPDVPFLSDFKTYFDVAAWPANEVKAYALTHLKKMDEIHRVLSYFDVSNLTPSVRVPIFMGVGLLDDICPPHINFAAYNNASTTDKSFLLYPTAGHSLPAEHFDVKKKWWLKRMGY